MKLGKEYVLLGIIGLFLFAYLLDAVVDPLSVNLITPYHYFQLMMMVKFPFSTTSIFIKALALFIAPLWLFSFFSSKGYAKPIFLLILAVLLQLYAIQDIATGSHLVPLEWSLAFAASGLALLLPTVFLFIRAFVVSAHQNLTNVKMEEAIKHAQQEKSDAVLE